jgi:hypothetical protein
LELTPSLQLISGVPVTAALTLEKAASRWRFTHERDLTTRDIQGYNRAASEVTYGGNAGGSNVASALDTLESDKADASTLPEIAHQYNQDEYAPSDDASTYDPKPPAATMRTTASGWGGVDKNGHVVTEWADDENATQTFQVEGGSTYKRTVAGASYPNWSAWTEVATQSGLDAHVTSRDNPHGVQAKQVSDNSQLAYGTDVAAALTGLARRGGDLALYDFESGLGEWAAQHSSVDTSGSGYDSGSALTADAEEDATDYDLATLQVDGRPASIWFRYNERQTNHGGGLFLRDADGTDFLKTGTSNPGYEVASNTEAGSISGSTDYGDWVEVRIWLDWAGGTARVQFEDLSSGDVSETKLSFDATSLSELAFNNANSLDGYKDTKMRLDDVLVRYAPPWGYSEKQAASIRSRAFRADTEDHYYFNGLMRRGEICRVTAVLSDGRTAVSLYEYTGSGKEWSYEEVLEDGGLQLRTNANGRPSVRLKSGTPVEVTVTVEMAAARYRFTHERDLTAQDIEGYDRAASEVRNDSDVPGDNTRLALNNLQQQINNMQGGDTTAPSAPTGFSADGRDGSVRLSWDANAEGDLAGYYLYRDGTRVADLGAAKTSYSDSDVSNGTTYTYALSAYDTSGNESGTTEASATPQASSNSGPPYTFDDGTLQGMEDRSGEIFFTPDTYSGSGEAIETQTGSGLGIVAAAVVGGEQLTSVSFYYREDEKSNGGGIRLADSSDNLIAGFATDNPEWKVNTGSAETDVGGSAAYGEWVEVQATLDWSAGTCDVTFTDLGGDGSASASISFDTSSPVEEVQWCNYSNGAWYPDSSGNSIRMAIDELDFSSS